MKIADILRITNGRVVCGHDLNDAELTYAFSSDLLSDVLTISKVGILLITGVANLQTIRTAEMAEVACILLVRNKKANEEMINLAKELQIMIIESPGSMFGTSGKLYQTGLKPVY
jgi:predicted transcriptional regulator